MKFSSKVLALFVFSVNVGDSTAFLGQGTRKAPLSPTFAYLGGLGGPTGDNTATAQQSSSTTKSIDQANSVNGSFAKEASPSAQEDKRKLVCSMSAPPPASFVSVNGMTFCEAKQAF